MLTFASTQCIAVASSTVNTDTYITYLTNERIIVPRESYLCCGDEKNPYNNILLEDLQLGKDYQIISREQWAIIESTYTTKTLINPIRRFYEKTSVGIRTSPDI